MQRQARRDTGPELAVRRLLHGMGFRYRIDIAPLPGMRARADLVFRRVKVAVFIDGCFWHGCPLHGTLPKSNTEWWHDKIAANRGRDERIDAALHQAGWLPLRFWAHIPPATVAGEIVRRIGERLHL